MRTGVCAIVALFFCGQEFARGELSGGPMPAGNFVKPLVSINFKEALAPGEVSLMVRAGLPEAEILQEIRQRGLIHPILGHEAKEFESKGATPAILRALANPDYVLTQSELEKYLQRQASKPVERSLPATISKPTGPQSQATLASGRRGSEIEVPLDSFTNISVNGAMVRLGIHDPGNDTILVKIGNARPIKINKAEGLDERYTNLTLVYANEGGKVYFVNTPRARMNMCILRIEPR